MRRSKRKERGNFKCLWKLRKGRKFEKMKEDKNSDCVMQKVPLDLKTPLFLLPSKMEGRVDCMIVSQRPNIFLPPFVF